MKAIALLPVPAIKDKVPDPTENLATMDFSEALELLYLKEDELKKLISQGEIGAKREPGTGDPLPIRADVEAFRDWAIGLAAEPLEVPQVRTKAA